MPHSKCCASKFLAILTLFGFINTLTKRVLKFPGLDSDQMTTHGMESEYTNSTKNADLDSISNAKEHVICTILSLHTDPSVGSIPFTIALKT